MIELRYRADVDGLRAVAVILVLLFHAGLGFSGGYVGVDVFFVISGFLITGLILKEQGAGKFTLANFWRRRIRRIIPAATFVVVVVLFAGALVLLPKSYEDLAKSAIAQQVMLSNVYFWRSMDYFDGLSDMKPLLHTWSLAVEEQFYLVYPLLLMVLARFSKRISFAALLSGAIASLVLSQWAVVRYPTPAYYLLPSRAWELLLGGLICFAPAPSRLKSWQTDLLTYIGLGAILYAALRFSETTHFPGASALLPCGGTALLIYASSARLTSIGRALAWRPVVFVGLISYSLYLWHWPALALLRYVYGPDLSTILRVAVLAACFGLACFSWRFVEMPIRRAPSAPLLPFVSAVGSACVVVGLALVIVRSHGLTERFPQEALAVLDGMETNAAYETTADKAARGEFPKIGVRDAASKAADFLFWGDSHAMAITPLVDQLAARHGLSGVIAVQAGAVPLVGVWRPTEGLQGKSKRAWSQHVLDYATKNRIPNVLIASRWDVNILGRPSGALDSLIVDEDSREVCPKESCDAFVRALNRTIQPLSEQGSHVWLLGQIPGQMRNPMRELFYAKWLGGKIPEGASIEQYEVRNASVMASLSQAQAKFTFLDPAPGCFDESGHAKIGDGVQSFYSDDNHLSPRGAEVLLTSVLEPVFAEMAATKARRQTVQVDQSAHREVPE